ncbi:hypothetical protein CSOJ01_00295 [Colletotrichum sojae]|uniref:Uncharacterized protein n=1 Tax=Colletotrichum sojae TaxID=2175907 RepID=A0A8H6JXI9_9PEZI|nr:hypothetical protein CSOJ01_00295 [Colletotrichum sojae]
MTAPNERPPTWTNGLPTNHADVGMQERSSHMTGREKFRQMEKGVLPEQEAYTRTRVVEMVSKKDDASCLARSKHALSTVVREW